MKSKTNRLDLGRAFHPDKPYDAHMPIVLKRHPQHPREGATVGYVEQRVEQYRNDPTLNGIVLDKIERLKLEGPDIVHNKQGLYANRNLKGNREALLMTVDKNGFVVESHTLHERDLDPTMSFHWKMISNKPTTVAELGVTDLVSSERLDTVTAKTTVTVKPGSDPKSPVPLEYLEQFWQESGYQLYVGDVVMKHGKVNSSYWRRADGSTVTRSQYPEYFEKYVDKQPGGKGATSWKLNDSRVRDKYLLDSFGIQAVSYVRMRD